MAAPTASYPAKAGYPVCRDRWVHLDRSGILDHPPSRMMTVELGAALCITWRAPHNIPVSSSAFSISASLTTTLRRGTMNAMVEAQAIEITKIAEVSGRVEAEWPPR